MRVPDQVFVDSGAWIALALVDDPHHAQARSTWERLSEEGVRWCTSIPVVMETFTFLDRNVERELAIRWKDSLQAVKRLRLLECAGKDLAIAWRYFDKRTFHKLSAVDASSFVLMEREKIRSAFAFDRHFAVAGFRLVG